MNCPTNKPRGFHIGTTWKQSFPRRFNVESMWCVCRVIAHCTCNLILNHYQLVPKTDYLIWYYLLVVNIGRFTINKAGYNGGTRREEARYFFFLFFV